MSLSYLVYPLRLTISDQTAINFAETANHISLTAAVLAACASVAALFEVLDYISSTEARFKCNSAAIDSASKGVKYG